MSKRVSDMIKMYGGAQTNPIGDKPTGARKWPPVATSGGPKPPPVTPKPSTLGPRANGSPSVGGGFNARNLNQEGDVPQWKLDMQRKRSDYGQQFPKPFGTGREEKPKPDNLPPWKQQMLEKEREDVKPVENNIPAWKQRMLEKEKQEEKPKQENIPPWKQQFNKAKEDDENKFKEEKIPPWKQALNKATEKEENVPSWRKNKPLQEEKTANRWLQQQNDHQKSNESEHPVPPWKVKPPPKPDVGAKPSTLPWSERNKQTDTVTKHSFGVQEDAKNLAPVRGNPQHKSFTHNASPKIKLESSSGSFGNSHQRRSSESSDSSGAPSSPKQRVSSFLHTKNAPRKTSQNSADRQSRTPPSLLKDKPERAAVTPRRLPVPQAALSQPPPIKTSKPANVVLPDRGKKKKMPLPPPPVSIAPATPSRPLPPPIHRDLPLPPPIGESLTAPPDLPPSLPGRFPASPSRNRDLPPAPSPGPKSSPPLPPPPMEVDDIYDDPGEDVPPPLPPMMKPQPLQKKQSSEEMIPTWEDEDDEAAEALYDETPDDRSSEKPPIPAGFPVPGAPAPIPQDGGDLYEDVEEYMRLKKLKANGDVPSSEKDKKDKEKKRKESEKKEKEIRKKFKIKGEINPEGHGVMKETCRGGGWGKDLAVTAGEKIEIIRMNDNPKGKWLIRNDEGSYGYVDSDKVTINIDQLRNTFGVAGKGSSIGGGSPAPPMIPTEDENIYDQTADEDVYEEL